ncbi:uncharacterized protein LOC120624618 isoform X2 [Pararge aegeria]|uniref:uncharacterized protein LOC120624618 isoform X2 n=1 Tax=Pararge aegeria TaxID=116150 RepID=UPI0019CF6B08|nr:uncharacterized protein LOC120624618 isoform X2 [Pararge aegeria]
MGGAVSSGRDNNELIDNLKSGNYIRTFDVEKVFRALDRAEYMTPEAREQAYKDLAWRNGPLHLSSPCIYSEVMEGLELKPGLSFLNIGSGTGYFSTLAGLILGSAGINHGVEVHPAVTEYAVKKIRLFFENSPILDDFDFCEPKFYQGNGLCLNPLVSGYDRVYCGAGCPEVYEDYFKKLIKVGGILVMPLNDTLLQVRRVSVDKWTSRSLLNVSFATLRIPSAEEAANQLTLDTLAPVRLQFLSRAVVRSAMREGVTRRNPILREKPRPAPPATCPRRICIPIQTGGPADDMNMLHDLNSENGANEMNALLSLVISMGQSRVAGALRFDRVTPVDSEDDDHGERPDDPDDEDNPNPEDVELAIQGYLEEENEENGNPALEFPDDDDPDNDTDNDPRNGPANGPRYGPTYGPRNGSRYDPRNDPRNDPRYIPRPPIGSLIPSFEFLDSDDEEGDIYHPALNGYALRSGIINHADASRPDNGSNPKGTAARPDNPANLDGKCNPTCKSADNNSNCISQQRLIPDRDSHLSRNAIIMSLYERPSTSTEKVKAITDTENSTDAQSTETADSITTSQDTNGVPPRPELPAVSSEVEIESAKVSQPDASTSTSTMEWEETSAENAAASEDDTEASTSKPKRQKLDSGIGEPSVSSPDKTETKTENSDTDSHLQSDSPTEEADGPYEGHPRARSPSYWQPSPEELAHQARMQRRLARGGDARRVRLSILMKRAVRELPLPYALKKFVNLGRCFEF